MGKYLLLVTILLFVPLTANAQKRAFAIEDYYKVKSISDVHAGPDGKSIIYLLTTYDLPRAKRTRSSARRARRPSTPAAMRERTHRRFPPTVNGSRM